MKQPLRHTDIRTDQPALRRVLVVDDSRLDRRILRAPLERWGYEVTEAASAEAALALCRQGEFDFVLSDWVMPGMSGPDFCRAFRALPREAYGYFILLTVRSETSDAAEGLDGGADDFLSKPLDADELRARLQAGARLLEMQRDVNEKNRLLSDALSELQEVHDALDQLATEDPMKAEIVKLRYFAGLKNAEIGALLGVNEKTVRRHWQIAKIMLFQIIGQK